MSAAPPDPLLLTPTAPPAPAGDASATVTVAAAPAQPPRSRPRRRPSGGHKGGAGPEPASIPIALGPAAQGPPAVVLAVDAARSALPPEPAALAEPAAQTPLRSTPGFQFQPDGGESKLSTGVERLDALLGGGYTAGCATLLFGPPFCGKQQLQQHAIVRAAREGVPVTILLHTIGAEAMSQRLQALDPAFRAAEQAGLVGYVDVHSRALGEPTRHPNTTYVEEPHNVAALLRAVDHARPRTTGPRRPGLLAVESASTLLIDLGAVKAFTFLRTVLGRTLVAGGVGLVCLEGGMHPESEVQMAKHLCAGMIEMRKKGEAHCLHVEGLETAYARPGWIEYEFTTRQFKVTGSFASRTIR